MLAHKQFHVKAQNLELAVDRKTNPRMTGMHKYANSGEGTKLYSTQSVLIYVIVIIMTGVPNSQKESTSICCTHCVPFCCGTLGGLYTKGLGNPFQRAEGRQQRGVQLRGTKEGTCHASTKQPNHHNSQEGDATVVE